MSPSVPAQHRRLSPPPSPRTQHRDMGSALPAAAPQSHGFAPSPQPSDHPAAASPCPFSGLGQDLRHNSTSTTSSIIRHCCLHTQRVHSHTLPFCSLSYNKHVFPVVLSLSFSPSLQGPALRISCTGFRPPWLEAPSCWFGLAAVLEVLCDSETITGMKKADPMQSTY